MAKPPSSSTFLDGSDASTSEMESVEYRAFIHFFNKLTTVFHDKGYLVHFVPAGIISPNDVDEMSSLSNSDRAVRLLKNISDPLECGEKQSFYKMLDILQTHGNRHAKQLAENIKAFVRGVDPVVTSENTGNVVASIEAGPTITGSNVTSSSTIDFSDCDDISAAFSLLTAEISKLLKRADFHILRRAILQQRKVPKGVQFPDDLYQSIKTAQDLDTLLDLLADYKYWSWVDLRLLETLIMSSSIREAKVLLNKYKEIIFSKKLSEVLDKMFTPQQKEHRDAYTTRVGSKIEKDPNEITVADLSRFHIILEAVIMDINNGSCVLEHLDKGCLEIHWLIPAHCRFHAYKSALSNRHKFGDIHLQYLHIEPYSPIYNPFTIQPTMLSTLLHLPKPIASTPVEVIDHYYCFLADNLDSSNICQTMLKLELITEEHLVDSAKMYSSYQKNSLLLDQLLISDTSSIVEFCHMLQKTETEQEVGKMLVNALESTPTDDVDAIEDTELPTQPASNEEDDTDISPIYQPEVFLAAKTVHRRFLNLVIQLKQKLKDYDPQMLLMAFNKLSASSSTAIHHKIIPLLPSDYLESLHNVSSEEILSRSAFLSTWNNHSILRALLEACNCQDGIKMLDDFESQIDTKQPMELFPIPPPSMKMAPSLSSAYTVLSIRGKPYQDKLVPLQYVSDVAKIIMEKFNISQHALQLLATRASPLMLYWTISKNIVPLISKGVNDHLDFLKENGFSEIAIYPNTILFATDTLSHGSYALLSSQPQATSITEAVSLVEAASPDDKEIDTKQDLCHVENWRSDSQPSSLKIKELETIVDDLQSELAVKSKEMDTIRNENKSLMEKCVQLKRKHNLKEDNSGMFPQPSVLDSSLEYDPEATNVTEEVSLVEATSPDDKEIDIKQACEQNTSLKAEVNQLKSSKKKLSNELESLKKKYHILTQGFDEAEQTMVRLEENLAEIESNLSQSPFLKKQKTADKGKESLALSDPCDDTVSDVVERPQAFIKRMLTFEVKLEEIKDMCHVENWKSHSQPSSIKMKELETIVDDLRSELEVKSKDMDTLKNEKKSVMDKYVQLKRKHNLKEDDSGMYPQPSVLDSSLEYDPENISNYFQETIAGGYQITCTSCASLPSPMYYAHATSDDASVYVGGGVSPDKDTIQQVYQYVINEDKWNILPAPQQYFGIPQVVDGKLTLFGGRDMTSRKVTNRVSTFHSDNGKWSSDYPDMLVPRTRPAVVAHLNDVIVAGGKGEDTTVVLDDIEVLNTTERQWQKLPIHLPKPMWGISATASKKFFHIVGYNGADNHCYNDAYTIAIDHVTFHSAAMSADQGSTKAQNPWVPLPDAPLWYSALVPTSSPPVILGGEDKNGEVVATATIYEQASQLWRQVDPVRLPAGLAYTTVAQAGKNAIMIIGGCTNTKTTNDASSTSLATVMKITFKPMA